jgi:myo-inositol 2-dehydrogenase / D-chiro-inositol 1-dehydrogenase
MLSVSDPLFDHPPPGVKICSSATQTPTIVRSDEETEAMVFAERDGLMSTRRKEPLKVGLIGLGGIAIAQTVPACVHSDEFDLVAVCRRTKSELDRLADRFHIPYRYTDYRELLAHPGLEAALVCTGPMERAQIIRDVLNCGLHVFSEKPLALDSKTAFALVQAAHQTDLVAFVGYMKLFYPAYARVKALLVANALGVPAAGHARFWYQQGRKPDSAFHNDTHFYALLPSLLGPVVEVFARRVTHERGHATAITLAFETGAVGTLTLSSLANWDYPWHESLELVTDGGHVLCTTNGRELYHFDPNDPETGRFSGNTVSVHWRESDGFMAELRAFAQAIRQKEPAPVPFELGLHALLLSEAVEQSVQTGHRIVVERGL